MSNLVNLDDHRQPKLQPRTTRPKLRERKQTWSFARTIFGLVRQIRSPLAICIGAGLLWYFLKASVPIMALMSGIFGMMAAVTTLVVSLGYLAFIGDSGDEIYHMDGEVVPEWPREPPDEPPRAA